jgi:hypothetical protein
MWEFNCVMSQRPVHGAEASTSHAAPLAPDVVLAHPEEELRRAGVLPAYFNEA